MGTNFARAPNNYKPVVRGRIWLWWLVFSEDCFVRLVPGRRTRGSSSSDLHFSWQGSDWLLPVPHFQVVSPEPPTL